MYLENIPPKYLEGYDSIDEVPTFGAFDPYHQKTRQRIGKFLKALEEGIEDGKGITHALRVSGIGRNTFCRWMQYPEFRFLFDSVNNLRRLVVEDKSFEVAITDKRATLERIFLLKKLDPSYRDRQSTNQAGLSIHIDNVSVGKASLLQGSIDATTTDSTT